MTRIRTMFHRDLAAVLEMEAKAHLGHDADMDRVCVGQHAWHRATIEKVLAEEESRGWVVEEGDDNIVGWLVYTLEKKAFLLRRLLVHPDYRCSGFGRDIIAWLHRKMTRSPSRKTMRALVRLGDPSTCTWMAHMGFSSAFARDGWGGNEDAVAFVFHTEKHEEEKVRGKEEFDLS